ncbi:Insulin-like growth factor binding protein, N-terminal [Pseudocohnilembus persalinus]|uniref:Insulin-like growth factor binding protein, N-terminal n=1 Tax=Pseudocohnilembus persalinus TaxID=266149 RepID=A0A0V0QMX3_PSEPJ|nr:Insulin-like growth factor binding protein, N-terminal [Pseudocohnilembus persalinus]|eukprot:KRX03484.1 Insulin-like growth factor binding protein, N-terminal [Pseudocohnilembus persalinus]
MKKHQREKSMEKLLKVGEIQNFAKGQVVFNEGQKSDYYYIVLQGNITSFQKKDKQDLKLEQSQDIQENMKIHEYVKQTSILRTAYEKTIKSIIQRETKLPQRLQHIPNSNGLQIYQLEKPQEFYDKGVFIREPMQVFQQGDRNYQLFEEGEKTRSLFFIKQGEVLLIKKFGIKNDQNYQDGEQVMKMNNKLNIQMKNTVKNGENLQEVDISEDIKKLKKQQEQFENVDDFEKVAHQHIFIRNYFIKKQQKLGEFLEKKIKDISFAKKYIHPQQFIPLNTADKYLQDNPNNIRLDEEELTQMAEDFEIQQNLEKLGHLQNNQINNNINSNNQNPPPINTAYLELKNGFVQSSSVRKITNTQLKSQMHNENLRVFGPKAYEYMNVKDIVEIQNENKNERIIDFKIANINQLQKTKYAKAHRHEDKAQDLLRIQNGQKTKIETNIIQSKDYLKSRQQTSKQMVINKVQIQKQKLNKNTESNSNLISNLDQKSQKGLEDNSVDFQQEKYDEEMITYLQSQRIIQKYQKDNQDIIFEQKVKQKSAFETQNSNSFQNSTFDISNMHLNQQSLKLLTSKKDYILDQLTSVEQSANLSPHNFSQISSERQLNQKANDIKNQMTQFGQTLKLSQNKKSQFSQIQQNNKNNKQNEIIQNTQSTQNSPKNMSELLDHYLENTDKHQNHLKQESQYKKKGILFLKQEPTKIFQFINSAESKQHESTRPYTSQNSQIKTCKDEDYHNINDEIIEDSIIDDLKNAHSTKNMFQINSIKQNFSQSPQYWKVQIKPNCNFYNDKNQQQRQQLKHDKNDNQFNTMGTDTNQDLQNDEYYNEYSQNHSNYRLSRFQTTNNRYLSYDENKISQDVIQKNQSCKNESQNNNLELNTFKIKNSVSQKSGRQANLIINNEDTEVIQNPFGRGKKLLIKSKHNMFRPQSSYSFRKKIIKCHYKCRTCENEYDNCLTCADGTRNLENKCECKSGLQDNDKNGTCKNENQNQNFQRNLEDLIENLQIENEENYKQVSPKIKNQYIPNEEINTTAKSKMKQQQQVGFVQNQSPQINSNIFEKINLEQDKQQVEKKEENYNYSKDQELNINQSFQNKNSNQVAQKRRKRKGEQIKQQQLQADQTNFQIQQQQDIQKNQEDDQDLIKQQLLEQIERNKQFHKNLKQQETDTKVEDLLNSIKNNQSQFQKRENDGKNQAYQNQSLLFQNKLKTINSSQLNENSQSNFNYSQKKYKFKDEDSDIDIQIIE